MIFREFAVDPRLFNSLINCQLLLPLFGASEGNLISRFPKKWKRIAFEEAKKSAADVELVAITEKINRLDSTVLFFQGRHAGKENLSWSENALSEHHRHPFSGVIGTEDGYEEIICLPNLDESNGPLVKIRQMQVPRRAIDMASAISLLFLSGNNFKFIDPHFTPVERYMRPMSAFLDAISFRTVPTDGVGVEYHIGTNGSSSEEKILHHNFFRCMKDRIPDGINLSLHFHPKKMMHDRWVLSTWAGVQFGQGLDEGQDPPLVNISLLDENMRQRHWDEYSVG